MLPRVFYLYPQNTQLVEVTELKDKGNGQFLTGATVTATLFDDRGNPDSVFNNIALVYQAGSDATYQGSVPDTFNPDLGDGYTVVITALEAGVQGKWSIPAVVKLRDKQ